MEPLRSYPNFNQQLRAVSLISIGILITFALFGCSFSLGESSDIKETQISLFIESTLLAEQKTELAISSQSTQPAQQQPTVTQQVQTTTNAEPTQATLQPIQVEVTPLPPEELDSRIQSAKLLLYEDMANRTDTIRYIKAALDRMGLDYKDDGGAIGWLKNDLLTGTPDGQPWDLIIISAEERSNVRGEFFNYIIQALDQGSSMIIETWILERSYSDASALLSRCGVEFQANLSGTPLRMFILDPENPVMKEPNNNLNLSDLESFWSGDIGDQMKKATDGDAKLLVGLKPGEVNSSGTIIVCMDNRLILQTYSTHNFGRKTAEALWENYIYYLLKSRFSQ